MVSPSLEQRRALQGRPPGRRPVMFQRWEQLCFLHWEVDPEVIAATLPEGLCVDLHAGAAYIGVVPFLMRRVRPRGLPAVPYLSNFAECNVRTYVHDEEGRPGVWFYSLDTDRWLAYKIARLRFHLPYFWAAMQVDVGDEITYRVRRRGCGVDPAEYGYAVGSDLRTADPGSLEFFLLERYLLYAFDARRRRLYRGRVHHDPYRYASLPAGDWSPEPIVWNGLPEPESAAVHACAAAPVDVSVFGLEEVETKGGGD